MLIDSINSFIKYTSFLEGRKKHAVPAFDLLVFLGKGR